MSPASTGSHFMPPAASAVAEQVNHLYGFLLAASFISCVLLIGGLIYFAVKYRRTHEEQKTPYIHHGAVLEFLWSFIPFLIFMLVFVWGWIVYYQLRDMPKDALEIAVQAQKWSWSFVYKNGRRSNSEFYVPVGQDVKMIMSSSDVIHSFFLPAFRTKQDVVPGRYSAVWFKAEHEGDYQIFCAEYCGDNHSGMLAKVHVVPREKYEDWLANDPYKGLPPAEVGRKIYDKVCIACHNLTAERKIGPPFKDVFGREEKLEGGQTVKIDENYIRESVLDPNAKIVAGYPKGIMPSFAGQLNDQELMGIIEFLKTVK